MVLSLMEKRRTIRSYQDKEVEEEKIDNIIRAALLSPTSNNSQPWEFIVVEDDRMLDKLSRAKTGGSEFIAEAAAAVVICADPEKTDVWVEDAAIATMNMQLAAEALELGSCWTQIRNRKHDKSTDSETYVRELLSIPKDIKVEAILALGYPAEGKEPHGEDHLPYDRVYDEKYGQKKY